MIPAASAALEEILREAVTLGASDVHLGDQGSAMLRVQGDLRPFPGPCLHGSVRSLVEPLLNDDARGRFERGQAVDFAFGIGGLGRFRGNSYRAMLGDAVAIRVLPERTPSLEDLCLPRSLSELVELRDGLVLVTGPTGSGKSATLAALVDHLNECRAVKVITLEDPVEFVHSARRAVVRQREVGTHVDSFATGLRDALREDPDVILVGEMRDLDTITMALTAAETGHLVLSTLHAARACSAIDRIIDVFPPHRQIQVRSQLADSLRAIVAQRLLPRIGGGRVPTIEVLRVNHAVGTHIRDGRIHQIPSVMQTHREEGMWVIERHLAGLVKKGLIDLSVAHRHAGDSQLLDTYLRT